MTRRRAPRQGRFDTSQFRITRGALILLFIQAGLSLVWLLSDLSVRDAMIQWLTPTADSVWHHGKVWTLVTGPVLEPDFASLLFQVLVLWLFVPALERWWGTKRFLLFALYTSLAGTVAGTLMGLVTGMPYPILGYDPFVYGSIVAFGILYGRQHVQFFGVLPMTGRQLMYGIIGFVALFVLLGKRWEMGAAYAASMGLAAMLTSGRWNPKLWWYKWRHKRLRRHLAVMDGGRGKKPDETLLN
ncbi:MAG: rhomboid family intramembrane serine protease [Myxococcales bacterium]|nr:rhomboid family intramembrane serine protease [Myxococcales bacterium]